MEAKVYELINEIACLDELNTIIVVTHDVTAVTVADHLWLMGRDRDAEGLFSPARAFKRLTTSSIVPSAGIPVSPSPPHFWDLSAK
jgi:hypothetical protein